jgi:hypothetical protein
MNRISEKLRKLSIVGALAILTVATGTVRAEDTH